MPVDPEALKAGVARLSGLRGDEIAIEALLDEVVGGVNVLFGLSGAGFMMIDDQNALRSVAASDQAGEVLEETQRDAGEGPCVDAFVTDVTTPAADLGRDPRYQKVGPKLAAQGIHAVLGVPIRLGGGPVGALNVYVEEPHEWVPEEIAALETYGQLLGNLLSTALAAEQRGELASQLQYALDYRVVIERAVGYLMASYGVDPVAAFNRLRTAARDRRCRVSDLAADVLARRILL
jgi:GAF domain-containing protein